MSRSLAFQWRISACVLALLGSVVARPAGAADVTSSWLGGDGSWTDGARWSTAPVFPENGTLTYGAVIDGTGGSGVSLDRDLTIDLLSLRFGLLTTSGALTVLNGVTLGTSAQLMGPGSLTFAGTSNIAGSSLFLSQLSVENQGDLTWTTSSSSSSILFQSGAHFSNALGAQFSVAGDRSLVAVGAGSLFTNRGTFLSQGFVSVSVPFNNDGTVRVQSGTLLLGGGSSTGGFEVDPGAQLSVTGSLLSGSTVRGGGTVELAATLDGLLDFDGMTKVRLPAVINSTGNSTARLTVEGGPQQGLTLNGSLLVTDQLDWMGGRIQGSGHLELGGLLHIEGDSEMRLDSLDLSASHGILWGPSTVRFANGAQLLNPVGAVTTLDTPIAGITVFGDSTAGSGFLSQGNLVKQGSGTAAFYAPLQTTGVTQIDGGTLAAAQSSFLNSGQISIAPGASLQLGSYGAPPSTLAEFTDSSVVSGGGSVVFSSGTQRIRGSFTPGAIDVRDDARVHFLTPIWSYSGAFSNSGNSITSFEAAPVTLTHVTQLGGVLDLRDGSRIEGGFEWRFGTLTGAGEITTTDNVAVTGAGIRGVGVRNTGNMVLNSGLTLEDGGTLTNAAGATLRASGQTSNVLGPTGTIRNEGLFIRDFPAPTGGGGTTSFGPAFLNTGVVEIQGAGFSSPFKSTAQFVSYQQTAGELRLSGGDVAAIGVTPLEITGGSLVGSGHIFGAVESGGRISPGDAGAVGHLEVTSRLQLGASSDLEFDLAGVDPGVDLDFLEVRELFLDGELSVRFLGALGSSITPDDEFEIVRARTQIQGFFDNAPSIGRLLTADGLGTFQVLYDVLGAGGTHSIVLTDFRPVPEPPASALVAVALVAATLARPRLRKWRRGTVSHSLD